MTQNAVDGVDPDQGGTDQSVIREVLDGQGARFEVLMRRYNQRLFRTARAILKEDAEAEDAVQQAYLAAYCKLSQYRGDAGFGTWLTRIVVNEALRRRKKRARLADLELVPEGPPTALTPELSAHRGELRALLERAVDSLPDSYRVVFVMRDVEELSTAEVGAALALSDQAVRVRVHRARKALREWLDERVDTQVGEVFGFAGERCDRIVAGVLSAILATE